MEDKFPYGKPSKPLPPLGDVPPGYFDTLEERIMARIREEEQAERPVLPMARPRSTWWRPLAAAACAAGILGMAVFGLRQQTSTTLLADAHEVAFRQQLQQIPTEELEQALIEEDVTAEEIAEVMDEETFNNLELADILSPEEVESLFAGTIASAEDDKVLLGLESSVVTDWQIEEAGLDLDDLDLSAFGLEEADLQVASQQQQTLSQDSTTDLNK